MAEQSPDINGTQAAGVAPVGSDPGSVVDALDAATQAARAISSEVDAAAGPNPAAAALGLPDFSANPSATKSSAFDLGLLDDVALRVKVELGRTRMYVEDVLRLNTSSVVELDKAAGDPVDVFVNDRHVARGEILVLNENFCVRISEIIPQPAGSKSS